MVVHRLARALAVSCITLLMALLPTGTHGAALNVSVDVENAAVELTPAMTNAVRTQLAQRPAEVLVSTRFRITSATVQPGWALVSVVGLDDPQRDPHVPDAGGLSTLVLVQQRPDGTWQAAVDGEPAFAELLAVTPPELVALDAKAILDADPARFGTDSAAGTRTPMLETASTVNYKFPWPAGQSWGWWQGWHAAAHDLGTTSTDRRVLAAAEGVVSMVYACNLSTMIDLKHADGAVFRYIHLDKQSVDLTSVRLGARLPQGLVLGMVKPDTWNDGNCGYTTQSPGWAHLHWIMPTDRPITIDGWTITFPTNAWTKAGVMKVPGYGAASAFPSTNAATTSPQPASANLRQQVFMPVSR